MRKRWAFIGSGEGMMMRLWMIGLMTLVLSSGCIWEEGRDAPDQDNARSSERFAAPMPSLREDNLRPFMQGQALFDLNWSPRDVGPLFNSISCAACHVDNGRSTPDTEGLLFRLSAADGSPDPVYGEQLQPRGVQETPGEGQVLITSREIHGEYDDGTPFTLLAPTYQFVGLAYGPLSDGFLFSPRIAQQMVGLGLLEALDEAEILAGEDPDDLNEDGISGRANWVDDVTSGGQSLGRFGWKANQPSLRQQNAGAFNGDLGMTSSMFPESPCVVGQTACEEMDIAQQELEDDELDKVTLFSQLLAPPGRKDWTSARVVAGEQVFKDLDCASCHRESWVTGSHELEELSGVPIRPYTDLLLHDMGPELADGRADGLANGAEWRTPPLWGIGYLDEVNGHTHLMHDGRARNIEEAILWHGGEAEASRLAFQAANSDKREALLEFLNTL